MSLTEIGRGGIAAYAIAMADGDAGVRVSCDTEAGEQRDFRDDGFEKLWVGLRLTEMTTGGMR